MTSGGVHDPGASSEPMADAGELVQVQWRDEHGAGVLVVSGELDVSNIDALRAAIAQLPGLSGGMAIDLAALQYIDSTGISLLYDMTERLRRDGRRLALVCPPDARPRRVLELTGLLGEVEVHDDLTAALTALRRAA